MPKSKLVRTSDTAFRLQHGRLHYTVENGPHGLDASMMFKNADGHLIKRRVFIESIAQDIMMLRDGKNQFKIDLGTDLVEVLGVEAQNLIRHINAHTFKVKVGSSSYRVDRDPTSPKAWRKIPQIDGRSVENEVPVDWDREGHLILQDGEIFIRIDPETGLVDVVQTQ